MAGQPKAPSGHVFLVERTRGAVWYGKFRLPSGRQVQRKIGPAWSGRGRPAAGYVTKRLAEDWLRQTLDEARRGTLPGMAQTGATFADAAAEFLRYAETDGGCKPSTLRDYASNLNAHLLPVFGNEKLEDISSSEIDRWRSSLDRLSPRTRNKLLVVMHGVMGRAQKVWGLAVNPVDGVEKQRQRASGDLEVFSPEEVMALVQAATSEQDAAIYLTAAFTGLRRGELIALRWRDVDFAGSVIRVRASYAARALTTPKSGKVRSVPMAPDVSQALAKLGQRRLWTADGDLVFPGELGGYLDGDALGKRYRKALESAGLRPLRFHDLRHTFGTRMIAVADIRKVQEWMGHADVQTTMRYLHYAPRAEDAALVARAFARQGPAVMQEEHAS